MRHTAERLAAPVGIAAKGGLELNLALAFDCGSGSRETLTACFAYCLRRAARFVKLVLHKNAIPPYPSPKPRGEGLLVG